MDRVDPGRAGIRHDDAGGAEDRQAADDAETTVQRPLGDLFAAGDRQFDDRVAGAAVQRGDLGDRGPDHLARDRIDRWLARAATADRDASPCRRLRRRGS